MFKIRRRFDHDVVLAIFNRTRAFAHIADQQTFRKRNAHAGSNHPVAGSWNTVRRKIIHSAKRLSGASERTLNGTLVAAAFNQSGQARLIIYDRNHFGRGVKYLVGIANQTFGCDDGHLRIHAVIFAFVDGKCGKIIARFAGNYACKHGVHGRARLIFAKQRTQLRIFLFQFFV